MTDTGTTKVLEALGANFRRPILGAYLMIWPFFNWRVWPYWFEDTPARYKIYAIDLTLAAHGYIAFWGPLGLAVLSAVATSFIALALEWVRDWPERKRLTNGEKLRNARIQKKDDAREALLDAKASRLRHWRDRLDEAEQEGANKRNRLDQKSQADAALIIAEAQRRADEATKKGQKLIDDAESIGKTMLLEVETQKAALIDEGEKMLADAKFNVEALERQAGTLRKGYRKM